jgi:two-component system, cell cycle response regulator
MIKSELKILLINCKSEDARTFQNAFSCWEKTVITLEIAETLSQSVARLQKGDIDLILLDLSKSVVHGLEVLRGLRSQSIAAPVLALVETHEAEIGITAVNEGAQDYLFKNNIDKETLRHSISYAMDRHKLAAELKLANEKIMEQQGSIREHDRLKSLLEQSGITAHELNQPLTVLLGSIYLIKIDKDNPEKISRHLEKIEEAGKRLSATVKTIQAIRYDTSQHYLGGASHIKPEQNVPEQNLKFIKTETSDNGFKNLNDLFKIVQSRFNGTAA